LGIETSCDDTGIAVIRASKQGSFKILSNVVSSQVKVHKKYGGIVPNLAAREHLKNIEPCLKESLKQAKTKMQDIDLIAVTKGPGLIPSLLIGTNFAKALAYKYKKPIVPINHIQAHILAVNQKIELPAIALTVSGGHTQLILIKKDKYKIIGETRDDAAGECFDKVAKLLKLKYPGGPEISKQAEKCKKSNIELPRPMINQKNYDFSFSGLKTAVLYKTQKNKYKTSEMAKEAQQAIIDVLISKTKKAEKEYKAKTVILAGGVAANKELRKQLKKQVKSLLIPDFKLCTDNGAMVAMAGYFNKNKTKTNFKADANLRIK